MSNWMPFCGVCGVWCKCVMYVGCVRVRCKKISFLAMSYHLCVWFVLCMRVMYVGCVGLGVRNSIPGHVQLFVTPLTLPINPWVLLLYQSVLWWNTNSEPQPKLFDKKTWSSTISKTQISSVQWKPEHHMLMICDCFCSSKLKNKNKSQMHYSHAATILLNTWRVLGKNVVG